MLDRAKQQNILCHVPGGLGLDLAGVWGNEEKQTHTQWRWEPVACACSVGGYQIHNSEPPCVYYVQHKGSLHPGWSGKEGFASFLWVWGIESLTSLYPCQQCISTQDFTHPYCTHSRLPWFPSVLQEPSASLSIPDLRRNRDVYFTLANYWLSSFKILFFPNAK